MPNQVGHRIKIARQREGLSQQELARRASVSQPTVANWERGSHAPRHGALTKIARALGSSPAWLLGEAFAPIIPAPLQKATMRAPNGGQLSAPHHHVPVLGWPRQEDDLNTGGVDHYISASTGAARPIALICADDDKAAGHFTIGSTVIFDRADVSLIDQAFYLISDNDGIQLRRYVSAFDCFLVPRDTDAALPTRSVKVLARAVMVVQTL